MKPLQQNKKQSHVYVIFLHIQNHCNSKSIMLGFHVQTQHFRGSAYYNQRGGKEEEEPAGLRLICCFIWSSCVNDQMPPGGLNNLCAFKQSLIFVVTFLELLLFFYSSIKWAVIFKKLLAWKIFNVLLCLQYFYFAIFYDPSTSTPFYFTAFPKGGFVSTFISQL